MKQITIFIYFVLFGYCLAPHIGCPADRPFIWPVKKCGSFSDICIKPESFDCDYGIRACQQCSPSTFSSTILNQLMKMMYPVNGRNGTIPETIQERSNDGLLWTIIIIAFLVLIMSILIFVESKTRCLAKCFNRFQTFYRQRKIQKSNDCEMRERENLINNAPAIIYSVSEDKLKQILQYQNDDINTELEKISKKIGISTCFEIPEFRKSLKLTVYENDNIVIIKQRICMALLNTKAADNFKMMQLQYNGKELDDNQYLQKIVGLESNPILCYMNEELKNSTILLQLRGNIYVPEMIQLEKCVEISQLKQIVNKENIDSENLIVIKGSKILESNKTIEQCNLVDNDIIKIIKKDCLTIDVKPVFVERFLNKCFTLQIDSIDRVKDIKSKILTELNSADKESIDYIFLFYESNYLDNDMFYFEFETGKLDGLTYCYLINEEFLINGHELVEYCNGDFNETFKLPYGNDDIILKKSSSSFLNNQNLINELMTFHKTSLRPQFVHAKCICRSEYSNYSIALEMMSDNSISDFIKEKFPISEPLIIKWSQQILDGLEFLHNCQIIHRNIKPSNILLNDDGNNAKISSFGLSRRLYGSKGTVEQILFSEVNIVRYMAPEMYREQMYNFKSDVYSFGATLTEIATGKEPFKGQLIGKDNFVEQIEYLNELTFRSENTKLKKFVNQCINCNYNERPFISELRFDKFLRQKK